MGLIDPATLADDANRERQNTDRLPPGSPPVAPGERGGGTAGNARQPSNGNTFPPQPTETPADPATEPEKIHAAQTS